MRPSLRRPLVLCLAAFLCLGAAATSGAAVPDAGFPASGEADEEAGREAATGPDDGSDGIAWPGGTDEWAVLAGGGPGTVYDPQRTSTSTFQALVRWAHHFAPVGRGWRRGNPAVVIEAVPLFTVEQDPRAWGGGVNLLFRYSWRRGPWVSAFLAGAGMVGTGTEVPPGETRLNFTPQAGLGLQYLWRPDLALGIEYRFHHLSNASRTDDNPGINTHMVLVGFSWYR